MDPFESRLKSLPLRSPSTEFGEPETFAAVTVSSANPSKNLFERMNDMPWKIKSAGIASLAASVAVIYFALAGPTAGGNAFGQAVERLSNAETVSYTTTVRRDSDGKVVHRGREYYKAPGKIRQETIGNDQGESYSVLDFVSKKALFVDTQRKSARVSSLEGDPDRNVVNEQINDIRTLNPKEAESVGQNQIDGVLANGYRFKKKHMTTTVWATASTGKILRFEHKLNKPTSEPTTVVWSNIQLDEQLDDSLFSLVTPTGYTEEPFVPIDYKASPATWVAGFLRLYSKQSNGIYPGDMKDLRSVAEKMVKENEPNAELAFYVAAIHAVVSRTEQGTDWQYFPSITSDQEDEIVFWMRNRRKEGYTAVYGDLSVREIGKDELPRP